MAKDRVFFLVSFVVLALVGAFAFRGRSMPDVPQMQSPYPDRNMSIAPDESPQENVVMTHASVSTGISKGKRAVPLELHSRSAIVQFMTPGMYVDITFTSKSDAGMSSVGLTLLRNVKILAIGNTQDGKAYNRNGGVYKANTPIEVLLEMTPREAEVLNFANQAGSVSLSLMDSNEPNDKDNLAESLLKSESTSDFQSILATYMMRSLFPKTEININVTKRGFIVSGKVPDPQMAGKIIEVLEKLAPDCEKGVVNLMQVDPQLVLLNVKVFEVSKDVQSRLGVNWELLFHHGSEVIGAAAIYPSPIITDPNFIFAGKGINFGNFSLTYLLDMLQQDGAAKVLAEPNLTTVSGATAHFFAGGEFPILIPQGGTLAGTVTVEFKKYGILLDFTPYVDINGLITLHVVPEVSTLDRNNGVILDGFVIPGLITRRADTVVRLWSGQSYIIAGLLQNETVDVDNHLYGLNKLPILGPLFSSKKFREHQSELMIIVTPSLMTTEKTIIEPEVCEQCEPILSISDSDFEMECERCEPLKKREVSGRCEPTLNTRDFEIEESECEWI